MTHSMLLTMHIAGALVGLLSGWTALLLRKGSRRHGTAGTVFFISMLTMCASAVILAVMKQQTGNIMGGTLTFYLVGTAWLTVQRREGETGGLELAGMLMACALGVGTLILGWQVVRGTAHYGGVPAAAFFIFGSIALLSAAGDVRMLVRGGVFGGPRLARHLWRMCTALLIATLSALAGNRTHFLPEAVRNAHIFRIPVLLLPVFAIPILMLYWLFRVRLAKRYKRRASTARIKATPASILA